MAGLLKNTKDFLTRRFTSIRFSWGVFSLFMSLGTFAIVLTDRIHFISLPVALVAGFIGLFVLSIVFDRTGIRQSVNGSESMNNPKMIELMRDVKDIKEQIKALKPVK